MGKKEGTHFGDQALPIVSWGATNDFNVQQLVNSGIMEFNLQLPSLSNTAPAAGVPMLAEPSGLTGQGGGTLDSWNRVWISATFDLNTGGGEEYDDYYFQLAWGRSTTSGEYVTLTATDKLYSPEVSAGKSTNWFIIDKPFPPDFMADAAVADDIDDVFGVIAYAYSPGGTGTRDFAITIMLLPTTTGGTTSNPQRGNIFTG